MKIIIVIVLAIAMLYVPGCTNDTQEEITQPAMPEINLDPVLLPTEKQPEITVETEGIRFRWPDQEWILMEDEDGLYALAHDLTYRLDLQPKRQKIQATPLLWPDEEKFPEALVIKDVVPVKEGLLLVTEDDNGLYGIAHLQKIMDEQLEWLIRDVAELPQYIISQDKSKVVYKMLPEGYLGAYHTVTGRKTPFTILTDDQFCGDWVSQINISPLGGYLTFQLVECATGHPIQFTIVGADSGRLIREHLPGTEPRWDHMDQRIVFQLIGATTTPSDEPEKSRLQQLGMYSLQAGDVDFFNRINNEFSLYRTPLFSKDNAFFIYPVKNDQESRLIIHHTTQQIQQSLLLPEDAVVADTKEWAFMNDKILVILIQSEVGQQLFIHHISSELTEIIGPIDLWMNRHDIQCFDTDVDSGVYYMKEDNLMQAKEGNHRIVFKMPKDTHLTEISTWDDWFLISVVTSQGEKQLYFVGL